MRKYDLLMKGAYQPGLYQLLSEVELDALRAAAERAGWRFAHIDGKEVANKADFLNAVAGAFDFPHYFGHNWDALEESIQDLSWAPAPGYLVLISDASKFGNAHPTEWRTARAILESTARYWAAEGRPMYVLLDDAAAFLQDLEWL